jgi:predicted ABC-type sugar transport system permease subunit
VAGISIAQLLMLYVSFLLAFLLGFLLLIARFYQKFASERTFFELFGIPIVLFGAGLVRYASLDRITGDVVGDLFIGTAGLTLTFLSVFLYHLMTRNR